ncbi:hypothetical protein HXZ94_02240 [Empedobacter falsenii]|uniref:hypothetical protein n=1 Tax=Empedobacter falsenii TaxID=343874 RepID=UPI00257742A6|nr:hypothetical protein [Empedobacter falsenii]MDM1297328.1 hypothetical protein [Empedobacter falsenii]MDM1317122.1 hypothetical protein [Empedobacter falsenii]
MNRLISVFSLLFIVFSCNEKPNCEAFLRIDRDSECLMIVEKEQFITSAALGFEGINPYTKENCDCNDNNRWSYLYRDEVSIGDTIIKRKGELTFNIHKRDTIISHEWECDGKTYNIDGSIKNIKP